MDKILKKSYKILIFSIIIFGLAVFFYWKGIDRGENDKENFQVIPLNPGFGIANENSDNNSLSLNWPDPKKLHSFTYNPSLINKNLLVEDKCQDDYLTILIFSKNDDYRIYPAKAKFNKAFECFSSQIVSQEINLSSLNLSAGNYYYFTADQGKEGSWYNPR